MDRQPGQVLADIERVIDDITTGGNEFKEARKDLAIKEIDYERERVQKLLAIVAQGKREGKVPAEDIRKALAHDAIDNKVWADYLMAKAKVEAMKVWIDTRQHVLSGLQSELQQMRVEYSNA